MPLAFATLAVAIGCGPSLRRVHRSEVYFERCYAADLDRAVPIGERRACWQSWMAHYQLGQPPDRIDYVRERILRLDPERAEVVALAIGEGDPVPASQSEPAIAAEAELVAATASGEAPLSQPEAAEPDPDSSSTGAEPGFDGRAGALVEPDSSAAYDTSAPPPASRGADSAPEAEASDPEVTPVPDPDPPPRTVLPARERRAARQPPIPRSASPQCAEACRPGWESCLASCAEGDPAACRRACRLRHWVCARGCY